MRCLAKSRDDRPASARVLVEALAAARAASAKSREKPAANEAAHPAEIV
jgi:hypothetical protein